MRHACDTCSNALDQNWSERGGGLDTLSDIRVKSPIDRGKSPLPIGTRSPWAGALWPFHRASQDSSNHQPLRHGGSRLVPQMGPGALWSGMACSPYGGAPTI